MPGGTVAGSALPQRKRQGGQMPFCPRNADGGNELAASLPSVLAQRAASEGPRWTRAVEGRWTAARWEGKATDK